MIGETLLHYRILGKLGQGGMGEVYKARDLKLDRPVAVKVLAPAVMQDEKARLRLLREARSVSALNHPNIVTIHAIEHDQGRDFLVMELLEGEDLRTRLSRRPLDQVELIEVGTQIAGALALAHGAGIIHRDIKPANIILTPSGIAKVLDFGLAKPVGEGGLTTAGMVVGTLAYMSPEQLRGEELDARSDIFSFGCVLYEAATGRAPFEGPNLPELVQRILTAQPASTGSALDDVLLRAMAKDRERRYETMGQLRADLRATDATPALTATVAVPALPRAPHASQVVGREPEMRQLAHHLSLAARGEGRVVFITGQPGIGKTWLAEEFLRRAVQSHTTLLVGRGRCVEHYGTGEAYLPFLDAMTTMLAGPAATRVRSALRSAAPTWCLQLPAAFGGELRELQQETIGATKDRMMREMVDALSSLAVASPVVLFIEDLHWADAPSIDLLRRLCQGLEPLRLLIVGTFRPADLELHDHPLRSYRLEMQSHRSCEEIGLSLLSQGDVEALLNARFAPNSFPAGLASMIHTRTEGHPLFVSSLLQLLADQGDIEGGGDEWRLARPLAELRLAVPASVMSMIRKQLEALSEDGRQMLQCASVQGEEFLSTVTAAAMGIDELAAEERLEKLARVHSVVRSTGEEELPDGSFAVRYRFAHALYQNVLYEDTLSRRRVLLHRQTAERLEQHYGPQAPRIAAQLAVHFERGREYGRAIDYLVHAGDTAALRCANAEAVGHFTQALALAAKLPPVEQASRRLTLYQKRGLGFFGLAKWDEAEADFLQMLEHARAESNIPGQVAALLLGSQALFWRHHLTRMYEYTDEALTIASRSENETLLSEAQVSEGMRLHAIGEIDGAVVLLDQAARTARRLGHARALAPALIFRSNVYVWQTEYAAAEKLLREALPMALEARNAIWTLQCWFMLSLSVANQGRISEGLARLRQTIDMFEKNGAYYHIARIANTLGWLHREMGDYEQAAAFDRMGVEYGRKYSSPEAEISSLINVTKEFTRTGDFQRVREMFHAIEEMAARDEWHRWLFLGVRYQATA
ncbi:MAG: serine/threonine-protein kinase PknK, partial [Bryobacteraceae bacterium]